MGKDLQTLNGQNKLALWPDGSRSAEAVDRMSKPGARKTESVSRLTTSGRDGYLRWLRRSRRFSLQK